MRGISEDVPQESGQAALVDVSVGSWPPSQKLFRGDGRPDAALTTRRGMQVAREFFDRRARIALETVGRIGRREAFARGIELPLVGKRALHHLATLEQSLEWRKQGPPGRAPAG